MIDWTRSYDSQWRLFRVNTGTWADSDEVRGVVSISITRDTSDIAEKCSITIDRDIGEEWTEGYYRIVMVATQGGVSERVDVATMFCTASGGTIDRGADTVSINGQSVLYPASTTMLGEGGYAPKGADGVEYAAGLLKNVCHAPVITTGGFSLDEHVVFGLSDSVLKSCRKVLDAGSHVIRIDGRGEIHIMPMPTEPELDLDEANASLLMPSVQHKLDYSSVKNRVTVKVGSSTVVVANDDPSSVTSYQSRGYYNDQREDSPTMVNGESPFAYARRRLEELSTIEDSRTYKREWWPEVYPNSIVHGTLSGVGIEGLLRVKAQKLTLKNGILVEETAFREVRTWQR